MNASVEILLKRLHVFRALAITDDVAGAPISCNWRCNQQWHDALEPSEVCSTILHVVQMMCDLGDMKDDVVLTHAVDFSVHAMVARVHTTKVACHGHCGGVSSPCNWGHNSAKFSMQNIKCPFQSANCQSRAPLNGFQFLI